MCLKRRIALLLSVFLLSSFLPTALAAGDHNGLNSGISIEIDEKVLLDSGKPEEPSDSMLDSGPPPMVGNPKVALSTLSAEIVMESDRPGLYITIDNLPEALQTISLQYSFNGKDFYIVTNGDQDWYWEPEEFEVVDNRVQLYVGSLEEHPISGYVTGAVENLFLQGSLYCEDDLFFPTILEPFRFSHNKTYKIPEIPPDLSINIQCDGSKYYLYGTFADFPPNVDRVMSYYSWDGINYEELTNWSLQSLAHPDPEQRKFTDHANIGTEDEEPLESFLNLDQDTFYVRLEIVTLDGQRYPSKPAKMTRGERQPLPEHLTPRIALGFDVATINVVCDDEEYTTYSYGKHQITVSENASSDEVQALLPDTIPVKISLWDKVLKEKFTWIETECAVQWKPIPSLSLTPGEPVIIKNAAQALVIPAGTDIETPLGVYTLQKPLSFKSRYDSDQINLIINPVAENAQPEILLRGCDRALFAESEGYGYYQQEGTFVGFVDESTPLSVLFTQKPSGATSLKTYALFGDERVYLGDLLDRKHVDYNQARTEYGYAHILEMDDIPYLDYQNGTLDCFSIEVEVLGGVFDGKTQTAVWPGSYTLPFPLAEKGGGNAGSENNAGSVYEEIDEDDDGQRPWLPPEDSDDDNGNNNGDDIGSGSDNRNNSDGENKKLPIASPIVPTAPVTPVAPATPTDSIQPVTPPPASEALPSTSQAVPQALPSEPPEPMDLTEEVLVFQTGQIPSEELTQPVRPAPEKSGNMYTSIIMIAIVGAAAFVLFGVFPLGFPNGAVDVAALLSKLKKRIHK